MAVPSLPIGSYQIPIIGIGTFTVTDGETLEKTLDAALEAGYRHIDTAHLYRNEHIIGRVLGKWFSSGKLKRQDLFVTTKLPFYGVYPEGVDKYLTESLAALQLDYVDLYLVHWPIRMKSLGDEWNTLAFEGLPTDHVAVWKEMERQVRSGRVRTIGVSNFNRRQVERLLSVAEIKPACNQIELNVYLPQTEFVNFLQRNGIVAVSYFSLGNPGLKAQRLRSGVWTEEKPDVLADPVVRRIARKHKRSPAQILLKVLTQRNVVVIPKSTTHSRIEENFRLFDFTLDEEDVTAIAGIEIGEKARLSHVKSVQNHPEYPHPIPD
ncbi:1,5-anhydro-D-fructose reductase-like isoform X2 [Cylas formicarius]|uniref:1,5-anhydro-D-fructose reductase-like isoform X2 n=1 Tax=Cylas formicarius TaxID=197179 RepID=UPI002958CC34|nr:1,5-anhydro-D-fructose reductase-like isoform X2 [Cylas formicarius]